MGRPRNDNRGGGRRQRGRNADSDLQDRVVEIRRVSKVVKGGRRFNFSALVVVGDGKGKVGVGLGKANGVPAAISKGQDKAKANMFTVPMRNTTIPHGGCGQIPELRCDAKASFRRYRGHRWWWRRAVLELAGIKDVLTKALGSTTSVNLVKATEQGLRSLRSKDQIEKQRGVKITI